MAAWKLTALQQCTRERADAVDAFVHAPLSPPSRAGYRRWLCELYRFIAPVENQLAAVPGIDFDFRGTRFKSPLLASDLLAVGLSAPEYARLSQRLAVPSFVDPPEALGWLFVVDRLTLRADAIRERLMPLLELELAGASMFLDAYSCEAIPNWIGLAQLIECMAPEERDVQALTSAAYTALDYLETSLADARRTDPVCEVISGVAP